MKVETELGKASLISNTSYFTRYELSGYDGTTYNLGSYQTFDDPPTGGEPRIRTANPLFPVHHRQWSESQFPAQRPGVPGQRGRHQPAADFRTGISPAVGRSERAPGLDHRAPLFEDPRTRGDPRSDDRLFFQTVYGVPTPRSSPWHPILSFQLRCLPTATPTTTITTARTDSWLLRRGDLCSDQQAQGDRRGCVFPKTNVDFNNFCQWPAEASADWRKRATEGKSLYPQAFAFLPARPGQPVLCNL